MNAQPPTYETTAGTQPNSNEQHQVRTMTRTDPGLTHMMSEIGDGVFVQWSSCHTCQRRVQACTCPTGPVEPDYLKTWRTQRFTSSFEDRPTPALPFGTREGLLRMAQEAQDAAYGDSNDTEIDLLREALEAALDALGLALPDGHDPGLDEDDDEADPVNTGLEAAILAARTRAEEQS